jgi:ribosomal protein S27E
VSDVILVEYKQPSGESLSVWGGKCEPKEEYKREGAVKCPDCGNQRLILGGDEAGEVSCPRCNKGVLQSVMDWIS